VRLSFWRFASLVISRRRWLSSLESPVTEPVPFAIIVDFKSLTSAYSFFLLGAVATPIGAIVIGDFELGFERGVICRENGAAAGRGRELEGRISTGDLGGSTIDTWFAFRARRQTGEPMAPLSEIAALYA